MLGAAQTEHLAGIERGAAGPRDAVRSRGFADGVATLETAAAPDVDGDAAVHMLVVDREGERFARDVLLVAFVEFDRQRVHAREPLDRRGQQRLVVGEIGAHVGVEAIQRERGVAGNRLRVAVEVHQHRAAGLGLAKNREINEAGAEVEHARGMERPLIALAENVRRQFLRGPVIVGEEIALLAFRVEE